MTWVFITTTSYLTESFKNTPATLVALASLFRNPAAAVAAVVVEPLMHRMGTGWCFTGLALMELCCVCSILWLMYNGKRLREELDRKGDPGVKIEGKPGGPPDRPRGGPPGGKPGGGQGGQVGSQGEILDRNLEGKSEGTIRGKLESGERA